MRVIPALGVILALLLVASPTVSAAQDELEPTRPPSLMLSVYRWATANAITGCELPAGLLAAIGDVTSDHGRQGSVTATDGTEASGPQLDDGGTLRPGIIGGPTGPFGPFQFMQETWEAFGVDANGDGIADPQNAWDSAAAAASLLCALGAGEPDRLDEALATYFGNEDPNNEGPNDGSPNNGYKARDVRILMPGYGTVTGRNTVGEPSQLGTYWTDASGAYLDRWAEAESSTPLTIFTGDPDTTWLVGDWNGDGATTPASYLPNPDGLGLFTFFDESGQPFGEPLELGPPSSTPLVGDWNADGMDEVGTFTTAGTDGIFFLGSPSVDIDDEPLVARFGQVGDIPLIGDWDGDGYDGPGVYRPSTNMFFLADQRGRPLGAPIDGSTPEAPPALASVDAETKIARDEAASNAFLEVIAATAAGRSLDDIGVLDLINEASQATSHLTYTDEFLDGLTAPTPLVADWDGDGFSDLALVRHGPNITLVERLDVHRQPMGYVELPWSTAVTAGRWEPRPTMSVDATTTTEDSEHSTEEVPLARVGGILVHADIADQLAAMIDAAAADGIALNGWGWRSHQRQIELRAQNCADVWETPSNQCSPPTARPGHSRHESGKAIDFHIAGSALTRGSPHFQWLQEHAADYGFFNLPSEPWHWSDTGR